MGERVTFKGPKGKRTLSGFWGGNEVVVEVGADGSVSLESDDQARALWLEANAESFGLKKAKDA